MQLTWLDWLASKQARNTARLLTLVLLVLVVYQLARLTWMLMPAPPQEQVQPVTATTPSTSADQSRVDASRIAGWHLFGQAAQTPSQQKNVPIDAPETRLNLILRGVFSSDDDQRARAIIAAPNGEERSYRIGDTLPGNAELSEIYADRIILLRNGRHETLRLPKDQLEGADMAAGNSAAADINREAGALLSEYRDLMQTNPRALVDLMRPVPANENNRFVGFRLYPGNRPELFQQLGLRPGDLVTQVNGIQLDSAAKGVEVMQDLRDSSQISLQIRRGNQALSLAFSLP